MRSDCQKESGRQGNGGRLSWSRWAFPVTGALSLLWFLMKVVPKPSRAAYPCQQTAAPLAAGFILWLTGTLASLSLFRQAKGYWKHSRVALAGACLILAAVLGLSSLLTVGDQPVMASTPDSNQPIGEAKGINPGRVVWAHDPGATNWDGPGDGHWWEANHTDQDAVDAMMSSSLRSVSGKSADSEAWDAIFRYFNESRGNGNMGYGEGEKITVKVNLVGCIVGRNVDPDTYEMVSRPDYMNTSPQMMLALLRQLVNEAGVSQRDITIGDPLARFPREYYAILHGEFPGVHYLDHSGGNAAHPRTAARFSEIPLYWSARPAGLKQDFVPASYAEAKYFINMANLKSHRSAGITVCAKNHYGSLIRRPPDEGYYDMHSDLANQIPGAGNYRCIVDLMGHAHIGGKTLLYLIDGLYPGKHSVETTPRKWITAPFSDDWTSSLFVSQDPVAIDSVAFDFLRSEWDDHPRMAGVDDYLHEAALANNPPSGTFYDPDHATNTVRLASLGVHEHWNNPRDKQYSRNLGRDTGIELIQVGKARAAE